jgi:hypothetical protein
VVAASVAVASVVVATSPAGLQPASEKAPTIEILNNSTTIHNKDFFILKYSPLKFHY